MPVFTYRHGDVAVQFWRRLWESGPPPEGLSLVRGELVEFSMSAQPQGKEIEMGQNICRDCGALLKGDERDCWRCDAVWFFDSHGGLWLTCDGSHPDAVAFGPWGVARPMSGYPRSAGIDVRPGETLWVAAQRAGRMVPGQNGSPDTLMWPPPEQENEDCCTARIRARAERARPHGHIAVQRAVDREVARPCPDCGQWFSPR